MYAREVEGQVLTFGVSGKLVRNNLVMYDHQTNSLWSQAYSQAIQGDLAGKSLSLLASRVMGWADWREQYPDGLVLNRGYRYGDPYSFYYRDTETGVRSPVNRDDRLGAKEFVLGLDLGEQVKAYPFRELSKTPVLNDVFAGRSVLTVLDTHGPGGTAFAYAYDRRVGERTLTFLRAPAPSAGAALPLTDEETRTVWDGRTGEAIEGSLKGKRLELLPATLSFWFSWVDLFPDTALYQGPGEAKESPSPLAPGAFTAPRDEEGGY
ncbi:MAG: DUF3179 domain-containing protein [Chloroflexi bacterium]|nr:DUF3179 domain-containing protein [Chloroflexota bacterium]